MKITRLLLVLAAALSLSLAVFATVRTNSSAIAPTQSSALKVADDTVPFPPGDDDDGGADSGHLT
ncbi:MAG TPA: hypothetical protein VNW23_06280 [Opitutaceae bacterium]|nr:hypothetical protein [Opitutaceae bacterium]